MISMITSTRVLYRASWVIVAYTVLIVVWGAWVRLSGSGDGCGDNWPLCNGMVVPVKSAAKTWIEFAHRASTAVYGVAILAQLTFVWQKYTKGHPARLWACASLFFTITEALLGKRLVTAGLVNHSTDLSRMLIMPLHLMNTSLLLASAVMTAESIQHGDRRRHSLSTAERNWGKILIVATTAILASGAIAALGSHLAPSESLMQGLAHDLSTESHPAVRLRIIHPILALAIPIALLLCARPTPDRALHSSRNIWWGRLAWGTVVAVGVGIATLTLLAPIWLKLTHLVMANILVILFTLCAFHSLRPASVSGEPR